MFRFTICELVLLTLVVAMGVGWWIDHREQVRQRKELTDWMLKVGEWNVSPL